MIHKMDKRQQKITSEREMGFEEDASRRTMIHNMDKRQQNITSEREMGFEEDRMNI